MTDLSEQQEKGKLPKNFLTCLPSLGAGTFHLPLDPRQPGKFGKLS